MIAPSVSVEAGTRGSLRREWALLLVMSLAAVVRLYHLGAENFWVDEILSLGETRSVTEGLAGFYRLSDTWTARPFALVLLHYSQLLGESEFLARLPYAILSIAEVGLLFLVAREIAGRRTALRASLFLALLPIHVWYAQEARWYAQWSFLSTLSFWALVRAWKTDRLGWWVAYGFAALTSIYTYVVSIQLLTVQAASGWLLPKDDKGWSFRWKLVMALGILAILSWPMFSIAQGLRVEGGGGGVGTPRATTFIVLPYTFFAFVAGYSVGPTVAELHAFPGPGWILRNHPEVLLYSAVFGAIALLGLWATWGRRAAAAIVLPWSVGLPLLVFASAVVAGQTYNVRYALAAVPGLALLLALGVERLGRWMPVGTIAAVGLFGFSLANYYWNPRYDKEHVREATAYIRLSSGEHEPVALIGQGQTVAEYYAPDLELRRLYRCRPTEPETDRERQALAQLEELRDEPRLWLLVSRDWIDYADTCIEGLRATHSVVEPRRFSGVELYLIERR